MRARRPSLAVRARLERAWPSWIVEQSGALGTPLARPGSEIAMKSTDYRRIDVPIRLHMSFEDITVGELSKLLRIWQALLRAAWRESYERRYREPSPNARILVNTASTSNSLDIISDIAVHLAFVSTLAGPVRDWPAVVRDCYRYLGSAWMAERRQQPIGASEHTLNMRGVQAPENLAGTDAYDDSMVRPYVRSFMETANGGGIRVTVEVTVEVGGTD